MKFFKAKFIKDGVPFGRAYTYRSNLDLKPGDIVPLGTTEGIVIDEPVDEKWIESYGADNLKEIKMKMTPKKEGKK